MASNSETNMKVLNDYLKKFAGTVIPCALACSMAIAAPLQEVRFDSNTTLPSSIDEAVAGFVGREITAELLKNVIDEVSRYCQEQGFDYTQAFIPEQVIKNGVLNLYVHESRLGKVTVADAAGLTEGTVQMLSQRLYDAQGELLDPESLENHLLKLSDLGVFDVKGRFTEDLNPNLMVEYEDNGLASFNVFADNHGTKSAGRYRFGALGKLKNLTGNADTLSLFYARSDEQQNNYSLGYEIPVSTHPTVLGFVICLSDYDLAREYAQLGAQGRSQTYEAYIREPLVRDAAHRLDLTFGLRYRDLKDEFDRFDIEFKKSTYAAYAGAQGMMLTDDGTSLGGFAKITLGKLKNRDDFDLYDDNVFGILNLGGSVLSPLNDHVSITAQAQLQIASTSLDSSEDFVIGGASAVSAYSSNTASGDTGAFVSAGLQFKPFASFDFTVTPHIDAGVCKDEGYDSVKLAAAGVKLQANYQGFYAALDVATALGARPYEDIDDAQIWFTFGYKYS